MWASYPVFAARPGDSHRAHVDGCGAVAVASDLSPNTARSANVRVKTNRWEGWSQVGTIRWAAVVAIAFMVAVTGCSSNSNTGPDAVAKRYMSAVTKGDLKTACNYVQPDQKAKCLSLIGSGTISGQDLKVHKVVVSGDRALVAVTGTICFSGQCVTASDPSSGMPSAGRNFDQAWSAAVSNTDSSNAASALERVSGRWYVMIS